MTSYSHTCVVHRCRRSVHEMTQKEKTKHFWPQTNQKVWELTSPETASSPNFFSLLSPYPLPLFLAPPLASDDSTQPRPTIQTPVPAFFSPSIPAWTIGHSASLSSLGQSAPSGSDFTMPPLQTCWSSAPPAPHLILFVVLLPVVRPPCHPPPDYSACLPHPFTYSYLPSLYHILFILLSVGVFWEGVNCNNFSSIWTLFSVCTVSTVELVVMVYE